MDNFRGLAAELGIERKLVYCWRDAFAVGGEAGLRRSGRSCHAEPRRCLERRIAALERKIGAQQMALNFFRAA